MGDENVLVDSRTFMVLLKRIENMSGQAGDDEVLQGSVFRTT
jgi:hypothetical protein